MCEREAVETRTVPVTRKVMCALLLMAGTMGQQACLQVETNLLDASSPMGLLISAALASRPLGFLAVGQSCTAWSSTDGTSWSQLPNNFTGCDRNASAELYSVAYGSGVFVVVGSTTGTNAGCGIWTGKDGRNWTRQSCSFAYPLRAVAYSSSLQRFVAVGTNSDAVVCDSMFSSLDGNTWNVASSSPSCAGGGGTLFAKSLISYGTKLMVLTSSGTATTPDGNAWTATSSIPFLTPNNSLVVGTSARIAAVGAAGGTAAFQYSDNEGGTPWTASAGAFGVEMKAAAFDGTKAVGVGNNCNLVHSTDNFVNIAATPSSMGTGCSGVDWSALAYSASRGGFVAGGKTTGDLKETFASSKTGAADSWTVVSLANGNQVNAIVAAE